tara:strand:- start:166 stop:468 length:303 start_codon:yes stop_codon:yes gene_type:complete
VTKRISTEDVAHVANLARLNLTEDELDAFTSQLAAVLDHAEDIESLDVEGVEPSSHPIHLNNVLRADEPGKALDVDEVLEAAPSVEKRQFRVPPVLGEEL